MTGSRPVVWLHAATRAFMVSGYVAGTVSSFSNKAPSTRQATGDKTGDAFMTTR
jgi:hypothetical protein